MPCLCVGIEWLLDKFKAYVILRDRLLSDTSILRDKLEVAAPEVANGQSNTHAGTSKQCCTPNMHPMAPACVAACVFCLTPEDTPAMYIQKSQAVLLQNRTFGVVSWRRLCARLLCHLPAGAHSLDALLLFIVHSPQLARIRQWLAPTSTQQLNWPVACNHLDSATQLACSLHPPLLSNPVGL